MEQLQAMWDEILLSIKEEYEIQNVSFDTWLKPLEIYSVSGDEITLSLPRGTDKMAIGYITRKFLTPIRVTIAEMTGHEYNIELFIKSNSTVSEDDSHSFTESPNYIKSGLNEMYTFDTFVVGSNNRFAQQAALAVAESPAQDYNPLYIHGGPGLGKTHLMHAIGNFIIQKNPNYKVLYVTSESFVNEVIESIRSSNNNETMSKLREKYRTVDVLMIDDIQFIIGKESTQEEFFHTFNDLRNAGKQIILSSDRPPKDIETLEQRIRSRLEWGLTADIGYPDYETRMAILRKKSEELNITIEDDVSNYIAENIRTNIRELEGALKKLKAYSNLQGVPIDITIAQRELKNIISPNKPREITPQLIIEVVAEHYNLTIDQMTSKNRSNQIARPRQIAMYLCKEMTDSPLEAIGSFLGGRDHSTIIHGANKINEEYNKDPDFRSQVDSIKKKIDPN